MASSSFLVSGASEHAIAFANIGLAGDCFQGQPWDKYKKRLLRQCTGLLQTEYCIGLCLNEVGSLDDPLTAEGKKNMEDLLRTALTEAGATEHGKILWPRGKAETVSIWKPDVDIEVLPKKTKFMKTKNVWRQVDLFRVRLTATAHVLVMNQHQPSSGLRLFSSTARMMFTRKMVETGVAEHDANEYNVGYIYLEAMPTAP